MVRPWKHAADSTSYSSLFPSPCGSCNGDSTSLASEFVGTTKKRFDGVPQDSVAAAGWYRKATEQGVAEAQWLLGRMYADGEGVPQDDVRAFAWMVISLSHGDELGRSILDTLRGRMSVSQIEAARKLSNELAAKGPP